MARPTPQTGLQPSILDRLIDPESAGTAIMTGYNAEKMYQAVLRDLEDLLNTRRSEVGNLTADDPLQHCILTYGLPDYVSAESMSARQRVEVGYAIRKVIEVFEPRLRDVNVVLLSEEEASPQQSLRFRVSASLNVDPSPDVTFDTILEMASGHYQVKEAEQA
jgi:type VI secretion system protein ImpF